MVSAPHVPVVNGPEEVDWSDRLAHTDHYYRERGLFAKDDLDRITVELNLAKMNPSENSFGDSAKGSI